MKTIIFILPAAILLNLATMPRAFAGEWSTGLDIYSSYIWRGTKFGSGPAFQPSIQYSTGGLSIGAWGSFSASTNEAAEADLYVSYVIPMGQNASLQLTATDYYFPGSDWLTKESHYIEPMAAIAYKGASFTGAYIMNNQQGDIYLEAGYTAGAVNIFIGGGDGAYTVDGKFNLCNIGIGSYKEIKVTDTFSLPVSGAAILNPSSKQFYVMAGFSF